ncbi:MAG: patatin-like phospholipase family protein [Legionella sp.]
MHTKKINIYLPIPSVKTLSLGGGGARGSVYGPVIQHLQDNQILSSVEEVYGVSAGAITANLLAYGATGEEITQLTNQTNFKTLLKEKSIFSGGKGIFYTARLKEMVEQQGKNLFLSRIHEAKLLCQEKEKIAQPNEQQMNYNHLLDQLNALEQRSSTIKFGDLEQLRAIYAALGDPNKLKSLAVLAVSTPQGEPYLFSAKTYPDVTIADAVVASCAIPPVFKAHQVTINDQKQQFMDGGLYRSLLDPGHQINFKSELEKRLDSMELLLLPSQLSTTKNFMFNLFSGEGSSNAHIYGKPKSLGFFFVIIGYLAKFFFGANGIRGRYEMQQSVKEYGHNVVSMDVDISPNDFGVSLPKKEAAGKKAVTSIKEYLQDRRQPEHRYMLQGEPTVCLYEVPLAQFDQAVEEIKQTISDELKQPKVEQNARGQDLKNELHSLEQYASIIKTQREQQSLLEPKINTLISKMLVQSDDTATLTTNIAALQELMQQYLQHPTGINDANGDISKINHERLQNGIKQQLTQLQSLVKDHPINTDDYPLVFAKNDTHTHRMN